MISVDRKRLELPEKRVLMNDVEDRQDTSDSEEKFRGSEVS
jgi:hypothetical protein